MKTILFFSTVLLLLTCTGCLVEEGRWHGDRGHGHYHGGGVFVPAPVVVVPAPVVVVPVPVVRVH